MIILKFFAIQDQGKYCDVEKMFKKMLETRTELNILCKGVESLQQSKSVEIPLKCELVIRKFEGKCVDSSFRDNVVFTRCYVQRIKADKILQISSPL